MNSETLPRVVVVPNVVDVVIFDVLPLLDIDDLAADADVVDTDAVVTDVVVTDVVVTDVVVTDAVVTEVGVSAEVLDSNPETSEEFVNFVELPFLKNNRVN